MKATLPVLAMLVGTLTLAAEPESSVKDSITVEVIGTLKTGVVAIGGETTGTTITAKGITWELELNETLRGKAEDLDGKQVFVRGGLGRSAGVEIKERWIVSVNELMLPEEWAGRNSGLDAEAGRPDTHIRFLTSRDDATVVEVKSRFGIDTATLRRTSKQWPHAILVRLHLRGLESFKVRGGENFVEWSVSSTGDHAVRVALLDEDGDGIGIGKDDPYYTELRIVGDEKSIPLKDGYFEVPLPTRLIKDNPPEIKLSWIDFYRN